MYMPTEKVYGCMTCKGVGTFLILGGPNLTRRHHGWPRARKNFNFRASRLP